MSNFNFIENIDDFECNSKGYDKFLSQWSYEDKCTSRDPLSFEYKQRLEYFIDSCKKIHDANCRADSNKEQEYDAYHR